MAFWEFLLQKEGDRSWLPLESSKVEVLEGRYRVVAHARQPDMPIEVRITHTATTEIPPIRRTQKRFSRTNKNGLVVIMPFTRLLPGVWDLRCTSDLMSEMLGEGWQYAVRLQVLPLELEASDEWDPDWQGEATNAEAVAHSTLQSQSLSDAESNTAVAGSNPTVDRTLSPSGSEPELSDSVGTASDLLPLSAQSITPSSPDDASPDDSTLSPPAASVRLQLGQDAYVIQTGQPLTLMGQVETADGQPSDRPFPLEALQVRLYDPRTSQILIEERQPLTARTLPFPFTCRITLPEHFQTYLVLGEIVLYGATPEGAAIALVTQPFSVTTHLHELLESLADDFSETDLPLPANASSDAADYALDPTSLEALNVPVAPLEFRPSPQQPLPPQLRPADPDKTWQSLDLPSFHEAVAAESEPVVEIEDEPEITATQPEPTADRPIDIPITNETEIGEPVITEPATAQNHSNSPSIEALQELTAQQSIPAQMPPPAPQAFENDAPIPDWDKTEPRSHQAEQSPPAQVRSRPTSPEDIAFQKLNLQERFWTRLQALAADQELTEWLSTFDDVSLDGISHLRRRSDEWDKVLTEREVVVEDELPATAATGASSDFADQQTGVPVLPIQQPVPVPELEVTTEELTAGQPLSVQVKLPDLSYPLFVKLWLVDRQNRSVLDGPYWLTDFTPSGFGNLVSHYELTAPYGCLELQLEAIAIEMTTQRESDKAIVVRQVIPPNSSDLALDELDV